MGIMSSSKSAAVESTGTAGASTTSSGSGVDNGADSSIGIGIGIGTSSSSSSGGGDDNSNSNGNIRKRHPSISVHRLTKDRIRQDSMENFQRHFVPNAEKQKETNTETSRNRTSRLRNAHKHPWVEKQSNQIYQSCCNKTYMEWASTILPCMKWLPTYNWRTTFIQDIISGLTVGVMIVPQSMSYAKLAGLPVEYGLYSALVPLYMYGIFGSSRQLAVGPVALISLLLATGLNLILESHGISQETFKDPKEYETLYTTLAIQISFLVGLTYILMGILRLGFVTIFLSHAVISGFTTGAAVIIGMSQLKYFLGYDVLKSDRLHILLQRIFADIEHFNYKTFLVGVLSTLALLILKHVGKTVPKLKFIRAVGPLAVTIVGILIQVIWDLEAMGIPIVGDIPKGLPKVTFDLLTPLGGQQQKDAPPIDDIGQIFLIVISIAIVGFMESIAIAKQLASKHHYELDSSLELIGLGMANLVGAGFFQGYPVTGSFSRSAVNNDSGAQSGISGMVTATLVGLVLLFLTPVFEQLPLAVLASIVVSGVIGLIDYPEAIYLWKVHTFDFVNWVVACIGTLFLGVEIGLAIAVSVSLLVVIYESAYPHTAVLGRLPGTTVYRNVKQYPNAECYDGLVLVRIDAPIYFANTQNVREKIQKYEQRAQEQIDERKHKLQQKIIQAGHYFQNGSVEDDTNGVSDASGVKYIVLELSPVSHVDTSALHILHDMYTTYLARGVQLCFCNPSRVVMQRFVSSGLVEEVGQQYFFVSIHDAVDFCLEEMDLQAILKSSTNKHNDDRYDISGEADFLDVEVAVQDSNTMNAPVSRIAISEGQASTGSDGQIEMDFIDDAIRENNGRKLNLTSNDCHMQEKGQKQYNSNSPTPNISTAED